MTDRFNLLLALVAVLLIGVPLGGWRLLHGSAPTDGPPRAYGAAHDVPAYAWVVVLNADGVATADSHLAFFDTCLLRYRGEVREVTSHHSWYAALSRDVLVEYVAPDGGPSVGVLCPSGALFLLPRHELDGYNAQFAARQEAEAQLAAEVAQALRAPRAGTARIVAEDLRWVEAVNPDGLESFGYRIDFLDTCGLERGGTVQAIGESARGTLYAYAPDPRLGFRGIGIPCPAYTVFLQGSMAPRRT